MRRLVNNIFASEEVDEMCSSYKGGRVLSKKNYHKNETFTVLNKSRVLLKAILGNLFAAAGVTLFLRLDGEGEKNGLQKNLFYPVLKFIIPRIRVNIAVP